MKLTHRHIREILATKTINQKDWGPNFSRV